MFIFNVKVNGSKVFKIFFTIIIIIMIFILCVIIKKVFKGANDNNFKVNDNISENQIFKIQAKNYTNILKNVHENINNFIGKKINFTGYVYRVSDLKDNQFVLARNMLINSNMQYVVVGFLCEYNEANNFKDNTWVEITGEITKGNYHGDMPIIKITEIKEVDCPKEEYVYPPDESYISTSSTL